MPARKFWTRALVREVRRLARAGCQTPEIARRISALVGEGVTQKAVKAVCSRERIRTRLGSPGK